MRPPMLLVLLLAPSVASFVPIPASAAQRTDIALSGVVDGKDNEDATIGIPSLTSVQQRRDVFKSGSLIAAVILGTGLDASAEEKIYSANARNMARLGSGDSSGGSVYDNNPTSPKARTRRAMVGCKNSSARSLAGDNIGKKLSEKECNQIVMSGDTDFMLGALTELDCPTCPYGIGTR